MRFEDVESLLERQRQQEAGEQLHPGLHHPKLLQQAVPIAIQPLKFGFTALATIPVLVFFWMIDIHGRGNAGGDAASDGSSSTGFRRSARAITRHRGKTPNSHEIDAMRNGIAVRRGPRVALAVELAVPHAGQRVVQRRIQREGLVQTGQVDRPSGRRPARDHAELGGVAEFLVGRRQDLQPHRAEKLHCGKVDDQRGRTVRDDRANGLFQSGSGDQVDFAADTDHGHPIVVRNQGGNRIRS